MITLEISPETIGLDNPPPLDMQSKPSKTDWQETLIVSSQTQAVLGTARQRENPMHVVRFFQGKGGFCAVVTGNDLIYFGLPGSQIQLSDTEVDLVGTLIPGKPQHMIYPQSETPIQTVTHQAMILGAGLATRFEPISGDTTGYPKPGVPLAGEDSVIRAIAKHLKRHGFTRIMVNTYYKPVCLKHQLADFADLEIVYIDEDAPSGTAGGLLKAFDQGLVDLEKPVFIIQGDAITDADLSFLINTHQQRQAAVTIGGQIVTDADVHKFGMIQTDGIGGDGQSGHIQSFKEKPSLQEAGTTRFANAGFYVLAPESYPLFQAAGQQCLASGRLFDYAQDFFPAVLKAVQAQEIRSKVNQELMTFWAQAVGGYWSDMGNPTQYIEAVRDVYAGRLKIDLPPNPQDYYADGILYWPGTKTAAQAAGAILSGNVIVASRFCKES